MGQKVNPHGLRVGVIKNWDSRWFADDKVFGDTLVSDYNVRKYLKKQLQEAGVPKIEIERDSHRVRVFVHCAKPGMVIGQKGANIEKYKNELEKMVGMPVALNVVEVRQTKLMQNFLQNTAANFIGARKVTYIVSGVLVLVGILGVNPHIMGKLNLGIDFSGGRNYIVRFAEPVNTEEVNAALDNVFMAAKEQAGDEETFALNVITIGDANQVRISTNYRINDNSETLDDEIEALLYAGCQQFLPEGTTLDEFKSTEINPTIGIMQSQKVGPAIADDITQSAIWAVLAALLGIFLYVLARFRNFAFSVGALTGLAHNTLIVLGAYALLWKVMPFSMEIDQAFIAAILKVIGYSINDTVVIFDRVREYTGLYPKRDRKQNINDALNHTLSRTFSTSMSTLVVLIAIFCFGGETIRGFVFALLIGVVVGTYSSLCVATPLAYDIQEALERRKAKKAALK